MIGCFFIAHWKHYVVRAIESAILNARERQCHGAVSLRAQPILRSASSAHISTACSFERAPRGRRPLPPYRNAGCIVRGARRESATASGEKVRQARVVLDVVLSSHTRGFDRTRRLERGKKSSEVANGRKRSARQANHLPSVDDSLEDSQQRLDSRQLALVYW